jgi:hypothetical protein
MDQTVIFLLLLNCIDEKGLYLILFMLILIFIFLNIFNNNLEFYLVKLIFHLTSIFYVTSRILESM